MFQDFLIRKMLRTQGVPDAQIGMFIEMIKKNPDLFKNIAEEVQEKIKGGMAQSGATMAVLKKYQDELQKLV